MDLGLHTGTGLASSGHIGSLTVTQAKGVSAPSGEGGALRHQYPGSRGGGGGDAPPKKGPVYGGPSVLKYYGLAAVGGTLAGVFLTGESAMDVAFALNGALGAVIGLAIGKMAESKMSTSYDSYYPLIGAIAVPALAGGQLDMVVAGVGVGAYAGCQLSYKF